MDFARDGRKLVGERRSAEAGMEFARLHPPAGCGRALDHNRLQPGEPQRRRGSQTIPTGADHTDVVTQYASLRARRLYKDG